MNIHRIFSFAHLVYFAKLREPFRLAGLYNYRWLRDYPPLLLPERGALYLRHFVPGLVIPLARGFFIPGIAPCALPDIPVGFLRGIASGFGRCGFQRDPEPAGEGLFSFFHARFFQAGK